MPGRIVFAPKAVRIIERTLPPKNKPDIRRIRPSKPV